MYSGSVLSWLLAILSTVLSSRNLLRKHFSCKLHINQQLCTYTASFTLIRATVLLWKLLFTWSYWDLGAAWCFISIPYVQAWVGHVLGARITPEPPPDFLLLYWGISPPPFLPLSFHKIHLRYQTPHVQLAVLLLSEVWSTVKIVTLFQSFHQKLIGLLKWLVDSCSSEFNLSSRVGGMRRRRSKDMRNSLGKQVIRSQS